MPKRSSLSCQDALFSADDEFEVDLICYKRTRLEDDTDVHETGKSILSDEWDGAGPGAANDQHTYGNDHGRGILSEFEELKASFKRQEERLNKNDSETRDLQQRVRLLAHNSEGYLKIRERFLEYNNPVDNAASGQVIRGGNEAAHAGDAMTDADIYTCGRRKDEILFTDLYGVSPETASKLADELQYGHIAILNTMASLKSRLRERRITSIPQEVSSAFTKVISIVADKAADPTRVTSSFAMFWKAYYAKDD